MTNFHKLFSIVRITNLITVLQLTHYNTRVHLNPGSKYFNTLL